MTLTREQRDEHIEIIERAIRRENVWAALELAKSYMKDYSDEIERLEGVVDDVTNDAIKRADAIIDENHRDNYRLRGALARVVDAIDNGERLHPQILLEAVRLARAALQPGNEKDTHA